VTRSLNRRIADVVAVVSLVLAAGGHAGATPEPTGLRPPPREMAIVRERIDAAFDRAEETGDLVDLEIALEAVFDSVIAHVDSQRPEVFVEAAFAKRLAAHLARADAADAMELLPSLRANIGFAKALAFAAKPDQEDMKRVYALANRFRKERGEYLNMYPFFAAAICIVHDEPFSRRYNENVGRAPDPIVLFDFYRAFEKQQAFGLVHVPTELMIYVVDATAPIEDLQWAVANFAGDPQVGRRFFDIEYDREHFYTGAPKKSTAAGWGLPNIARYGGVCADQAYFAVTVGKAIGVPTAYTVGQSGDVAHAWVGYLQSDGRTAWWNFSEGRYGAYNGVKGIVLDPQIRKYIPDSYVSLLADFALSKTEDRYAAAALTDAAARLLDIEDAKAKDASFEWKPEAIIDNVRAQRGIFTHEPALEDELHLLEQGLRRSPGYAPGWLVIRDLAAAGRLELADKKKWAEILSNLCGRRFPDFNLAILIPMVETVDDVAEQNSFWNASFRQFQGRADLCAEVRMKQGDMWEKAGDVNQAGQCYLDVINRFANAGPFVRDALKAAEKLLRNSGREEEIVALYADTWATIQRPEDMAGQFAVQSNWYQVGAAYAEKLHEAGMTAEAQRVRAVIAGQ